MSTIVGIMDRDSVYDQHTDVNVVVDPERKTLTWIPRDLWSDFLGDRINSAYQRTGDADPRYLKAVAEAGFSVQNVALVWPAAIRRALTGISVRVPVEKLLHFWYPMRPWIPIAGGRKEIFFYPPFDILTGERIHQWMGARYPVDESVDYAGDLGRIQRQQVLLRRLLEEGFDFCRIRPPGLRASQSAIEEIGSVNASWSFLTMDSLTPGFRDGKWIFVPPKKGTP